MAKPKKPANNPNQLRVTATLGERSEEALHAEIAYDPAARSLAGARGFIKGTMGEQPLTESLAALKAQIKDVQGGSLAVAENTLVAQANTLDAMFNELARRAALNMGEYLGATEVYLRLALRAQAQCARTLETLAAIKNPPVIYARQANVATNQQINFAGTSRAAECVIAQNEQSEASHELLQDTRASSAAIGSDPALASVGEVHRAEVGGG
jgi:hypothetical protein